VAKGRRAWPSLILSMGGKGRSLSGKKEDLSRSPRKRKFRMVTVKMSRGLHYHASLEEEKEPPPNFHWGRGSNFIALAKERMKRGEREMMWPLKGRSFLKGREGTRSLRSPSGKKGGVTSPSWP